MSKYRFYTPELDSLRFIAFLLILIHHSPSATIIPFWINLKGFGWIGVDLFLCLSAFLITKLLFIEYQENRKINAAFFYIRRALRIWPLYFFFIVLMVFSSLVTMGKNDEIFIRLLGLITFSDNIVSMFQGFNYTIFYTAHLWTISYEEQFYLVIPWVLLSCFSLKKPTVALILVMLVIIGTFFRSLFIYYEFDHPDIWVFPVTHFESIIGGFVIGIGYFDGSLKRLPNLAIFLVGITSFWAVSILPNIYLTQWKLILTYPLVGIGSALTVYSVTRGNLGLLTIALRLKVLGYLGKISYGLYVYHLASLAMTFNIINPFISPRQPLLYPSAILATSLIISIVISIFSYEILEKPFLRYKERFAFILSRPV